MHKHVRASTVSPLHPENPSHIHAHALERQATTPPPVIPSSVSSSSGLTPASAANPWRWPPPDPPRLQPPPPLQPPQRRRMACACSSSGSGSFPAAVVVVRPKKVHVIRKDPTRNTTPPTASKGRAGHQRQQAIGRTNLALSSAISSSVAGSRPLASASSFIKASELCRGGRVGATATEGNRVGRGEGCWRPPISYPRTPTKHKKGALQSTARATKREV